MQRREHDLVDEQAEEVEWLGRLRASTNPASSSGVDHLVRAARDLGVAARHRAVARVGVQCVPPVALQITSLDRAVHRTGGEVRAVELDLGAAHPGRAVAAQGGEHVMLGGLEAGPHGGGQIGGIVSERLPRHRNILRQPAIAGGTAVPAGTSSSAIGSPGTSESGRTPPRRRDRCRLAPPPARRCGPWPRPRRAAPAPRAWPAARRRSAGGTPPCARRRCDPPARQVRSSSRRRHRRRVAWPNTTTDR